MGQIHYCRALSASDTGPYLKKADKRQSCIASNACITRTSRTAVAELQRSGPRVENVHLGRREREVEEVQILLLVLQLLCLGIHGNPELPLPLQHDLRRAGAVGGGDLFEPRVAEQLADTARPAVGRVALVVDPV